MDVLAFLSSSSSCPHLYHRPAHANATDVSNDSVVAVATNAAATMSLIMQHYNHTGRLRNRSLLSNQSRVSITGVVSLLISLFIILENLLVLVAVLSRIRHSRRWVYVCIANITLSDLLTGSAFVVNICMSGSKTFQLTPQLWLFREGLLFVALAASIFSLLLIAVERYTTMMGPLRQKSARKTYRIYMPVVVCWVLALVVGFLPLLGWNCVCNLDTCSTLLPLYSKSYVLFAMLIFLIILLAIGVLYTAIYYHVCKNADSGFQRSHKRSLGLLKTVITIVGVFMLCWGPLFLLLLVDFFCVSRQCMLLLKAEWFICLAVLNSGLNPIIYTLGSIELRKAIAGLLCCCCVKAGLCHPDNFTSKETSSTSRDSLRNSFNKVRNLSVGSPPSTPRKNQKGQGRKYRISSTTTCLSVSSN
ncbi:unnamed protein product [Merluccius merluccius]